jgi:predicted enzyme related to lactoylglutathione lyase
LSYFGATNVAASYLKAITLGATSFVLPTEVPGMGSFAVLADPQGAIFALATVAG